MARLAFFISLAVGRTVGFTPMTLRSRGVVNRQGARGVATLAPLTAPPLAPEDQWIGKLDLDGFGSEIRFKKART